MKHILFVSILLILLSMSWAASADVGYSLERWTISNGGRQSQGGTYALQSTIGQFGTSLALTGGPYSVTSSFYINNETAPSVSHIYLPLIILEQN
ncbi:MAG: hypothetical protein AAF702_27725 [Chloroflexota bacterium]